MKLVCCVVIEAIGREVTIALFAFLLPDLISTISNSYSVAKAEFGEPVCLGVQLKTTCCGF